MRTTFGLALGVAASLTACQADPPAPPEAKPARRPPPPACDQARAELERRQSNGVFLFEDSGEAMTDRRSWMQLDQSGRDEIIEKLAVLAACSAAAPQSEVEVTVRDEGGMVLTSERVEPSTDFRAR